MTLRDVFEHVNEFSEAEWLYLSSEADLSLEIEAVMAEVDVDEVTHKEILPPELAAKNMTSTIDVQTLADIVMWADRLAGKRDDAVRLESLRYYLRFDAFLPKIGADDPPSRDVVLLELDKKFYDVLGEEDSAKKCRKEGCQRGVVKFSVFCRIHHFEMIKNRPCPFDC